MTPKVLIAHNRCDVINAYNDARTRHTLIGCWISPDDLHVSWVCYRTALGDFARLMFYPDETP